MFGASRRGMIGRRVDPDTNDDKSAEYATRPFVSTTEGQVEINGLTKLSFGGDCGALYLDEDGTPCFMHTAIEGTPKDNPTLWTSHGCSLQAIVDAHPVFSSHRQHDGASHSSLLRHQSSPNHRDDETMALEKIVCQDFQYPTLYFAADPDRFIEYGSLPHSSIPMWFPDDDDDDDSTQSHAQEEDKKVQSIA
jgi:hypothetical protein